MMKAAHARPVTFLLFAGKRDRGVLAGIGAQNAAYGGTAFSLRRLRNLLLPPVLSLSLLCAIPGWSLAVDDWPGAGGSAVFSNQGETFTFDDVRQFDTLSFQADANVLEGGILVIKPAQGTTGTIEVGAGLTASIASSLSGKGMTLDKTGSGTLHLDGTLNSYDGGSHVRAGVLSLGAQSAAGIGNIVVDSGAVLEANFGGMLTNSISGDGSFVKKGSDQLTLVGSNTYSGKTEIVEGSILASGPQSLSSSSHYSIQGGELLLDRTPQSIGGLSGNSGTLDLSGTNLTVNQREAASFSGALKGGPDATFIMQGPEELSLKNIAAFQGAYSIETGASLELTSESGLFLDNGLGGAGTVALKAGASSDDVRLGSGVGGDFTGTVEVRRGNFALDDEAEKALADAGLRLGGDASANLDHNRSIHSLALDGGQLRYAYSGSSPAGVLTVEDFAVTDKGGVIVLDVPDNDTVPLPENLNYYDYAGNGKQTVLVAVSGTVSGSAELVELRGSDGTRLNDKQERNIEQGGVTVGKAYFGLGATLATSGANKGLSYGHSLTEMEADQGKEVELDSDKAQSSSPVLTARLTGAGGFVFSGQAEAKVGNTRSNYTGVTRVDSGNVSITADNAFGKTSALVMDGKSRVDFNGYSQTVGLLSGGEDSAISFGGEQESGGRLVVEQSSESRFDGSISGKGELVKLGQGRLVLGGKNSYIGDTDVSAGTLIIRGAMQQSRVIVRNNASLGILSQGNVSKNVQVNKGGALIVGGGGAIGGDLTMASGSVIAARSGNSALTVGGSVNLADGVQVQLQGNGWEQGSYALLSAANTSDLDGFNEVFVPGFMEEYRVVNENGSLVLRYTNRSPNNMTRNQQRVYHVLADLDKNSYLYQSLCGIDAGELGNALDMLSGEVHSSLHGNLTLIGRNLSKKMSGHISRASLKRRPIIIDESTYMDPGDYDRFSTYSGRYLNNEYSLWGTVGGTYAEADATEDAAKSTLQGPEVAVGMDALFSSGLVAGVAFQYSYKDFEIDDRNSEADINSYSLSIYGGREMEVGGNILRLLMGGIYSFHDISTTREVRISSVRENLDADYNANSLRVYMEGAYSMLLADRYHVEPFLNFGWNWTRTDRFTEDGGQAALIGGSKPTDNFSSILGLRLDLPVYDALNLFASLGWEHVYGSLGPDLRLAFKQGGDSFRIKGNTLSRDELASTLGLGITLTDDVNLNVRYDGGLGADSQTHSGAATLIYRW